MRQARLSSLAAVSWELTRRTGRALLLTGVAIAAVCVAGAGPALAQPSSRLKTSSAPLPDDGLGPKDLLLQADTLSYDKPNNTVTATGHVQARYQGKTLRSDRLEYNTVTGAAHAVGHAVIINPDGTSNYGDDVTLDDQFRAALAIGFAAREEDNVTLAAGAAIRRTETINELKNAIYTVCNICAENGAAKHPSWTIQATRITEDREHQVIYYRNAIVRVLGIPVFYSPIFWHPDPSSPRRSGLLAPLLEDSSRRGFSYEQPYLFTLGPSADLIVSPQLNTRVNPLLNVRLTERFYSGMIDIRAGYTYSENFDNHTFFDNDTSRSYLLARGLFNLDKNWVWGFGAERVTDPTFFQRYHIPEVYTDRGPFPADTDRLISQLYSVRSDDQTYISVSTMDFQSLRGFGSTLADPHGTFESSAAFPVVGPLIEARYDPTEEVFGGDLMVRATAVALSRNKTVVDINDPSGAIPAGPEAATPANLAQLTSASNKNQLSALQWLDSRRASAEVDWRTSFTLNSGIRIEPFLYGRGDAYSITNAQVYDQSTQSFVPGKDNVERIYGTAGATVSWPFIKPIGAASVILEPMAQVAVSPVEKINPNIPNEDSPSFEYDETNLFDINRFQGFDLLEGGDRLNVGGRATVDWGVNHNATFIVGRTFRAQDDPQFTSLSGLAGTASDWIVSATASPIAGLNLFTRSRLDANDFAVHREEAGISYGSAIINGYVRYDLNQSGLFQTFTPGVNPIGTTSIGRTEDIAVGGQAFFTQHWGVSANVTRDMQQNVFPLAQVGLIYRDECIRVDILYTHDETFGATIGDSNSVSFRVTLATLGDNGPLTPATSNRGSR